MIINYDAFSDKSFVTDKIRHINSYFTLEQVISEPTRVVLTSSTLIDLIFASNSLKVISSGVINISLSDHYAVFAIIDLKVKNRSIKTSRCRSYKHFKRDNFIHGLCYSDELNSVLYHDNVFVAWDIFKCEYLRICQAHAPIRKFRVKSLNNPWFTSEIQQLIYHRNFLHKKAAKFNNLLLWAEYICCRNNVTSLIRQSKRIYFTSLIDSSKNSSTSIWSALRHFLPSKVKENATFPISSDTFNHYYSTIGSKLVKNINIQDIQPATSNSDFPSFNFSEVNVNFVLHERLKLPHKASLDIMDMDPKLLRVSSLIIAPLLTHIFNLSLAQGLIPKDLKLARITPIYKGKGDLDDPSNYRPISVISNLAKILEKAVKVQTVNYYESCHFLSSSQFAYRKLHSTQTALHCIIDECHNNINNGEINILACLDLSKAFDVLDRGHLLNKLKLSGFSSQVLDLFNSYLSDRTQIVISNSELSLTRPVSIGVPQSTILGPILFLVYVNDLSKNIPNSKLVMYADDTTIICHSHDENTVVTNINLALNAAAKWFDENGLILNISKSSLLTVGTRQRLKHFNYTPVVLNGSPINYVDEFKLLGIYIDKHLT